MTNPNTCRWIMYAIIFIGFIILGISSLLTGVKPIPLMFIVGAIISFGGIIFGIITVRCPSCKSKLNLRGFSNEYCPYCGEKIE